VQVACLHLKSLLLFFSCYLRQQTLLPTMNIITDQVICCIAQPYMQGIMYLQMGLCTEMGFAF